MKSSALFLFLLLASGLQVVYGGTYYLNQAGGGDGSAYGTPQSLSWGNSNLVAGDTGVLIQDTYTTYIEPANSGSNGQELVYKVWPGDTAFYSGETGVIIDLTDGQDYIVVSGLIWCIDQRDPFVDLAGNNEYLTIDSTLVYDMGTESPIVRMDGKIEHLNIFYNDWDRADTMDQGDPHGEAGSMTLGNGDIVGFSAWQAEGDYDTLRYLHVKGNTFKRAWHTAINIKGLWQSPLYLAEFIVVENNIFRGNHDNGNDYAGARRVLIQNNLIVWEDSMASTQNVDFQIVDVQATEFIYRGNRMYVDSATFKGLFEDDAWGGFSFNAQNDNHTFSHLYLYHNTKDVTETVYDSAAFAYYIFSADYEETVVNDAVESVYVVNNFWLGIDSTVSQSAVIWQRDNSIARAAFTQFFFGNVASKRGGPGLNWTHWTSSQGTVDYTLAYLQSNYSGMFANNKDSIPVFTNYTARTYIPDETSPGYGEAVALTLADGSGSSSTSLVMDEPRFFCDGYGVITNPDTICVSGATPDSIIVISSMDYDTRTATITVSSSWDDDAEIFWVKNGQKADDVGAVQVLAEAGETPRAMRFKRTH